jgi:hypothetical protein
MNLLKAFEFMGQVTEAVQSLRYQPGSSYAPERILTSWMSVRGCLLGEDTASLEETSFSMAIKLFLRALPCTVRTWTILARD